MTTVPFPVLLSELPVGCAGLIRALPHGKDSLTRLRELGLVPGTKIRLVRRAPLGDPIEVAVRGSRFAMRRSEARCIEIQPE